jgi:hypothetical protein
LPTGIVRGRAGETGLQQASSTEAFVTGARRDEAMVLALKAMALLKADDAPAVELLSATDQGETYKVCTGGTSLLVRSSERGGCAAAHLYATTAARQVPEFRPRLLGYDGERGILVEEWLDPREYKSLGQELLLESASCGWSTPFRPDEFSEIAFESFLSDVGEKIGRIHAARIDGVACRSGVAPARARPLELLLRAAAAHPDLASRLRGIVAESARIAPVLLHGRLSPSSVLFSEKSVAIVGASLASPGDPALDLAHMMAHLFIASVHRGSSILVTAAGAFHGGYAETLDARDKLSIMHRSGPLCVAFMLAFLEDERISAPLSRHDKEVLLDFSRWWLGRRDYALGQVRYALWEVADLGIVDWRAHFASLPRAHE